MGISIGRVGLDIDGLQTPLGNGGYARQGDVLRLQGRMRASSLADGLWLREQLLGLLGNPDEPWVRLRWDDALNVNGLYVVEDVTVDSFGLTLTTGGSPYQVTLRRVPSFAFPQFESSITWGGPIVNAHGATATQGGAAVPASATNYGIVSGTGLGRQATTHNRPTSTGAAVSVLSGTGTASTAYSSTSAWSSPLTNIYDGAARIELTTGPGSAYRTLVGRQVPDGFASGGWRLTNDIIRVTPSTGRFAVSVWDGAAWTTAKTYEVSDTVGLGVPTGFAGMAVIRNSPDQVVIRLWCTFSTSPTVVTLDLAIARGQRWVGGAIAGVTTTWQIQRATVEAGSLLADNTPVNVGLRASVADAEGDRYVMATDVGTSYTAASGRITCGTGRAVMRFMCGLEVNGASATAFNTGTAMVSEFLAGVSTTTVVRSR